MAKPSILRWAGSKTKIVPHLLKLLPHSYAKYIEPFAGSASLFFALPPGKSILGDTNRCVVELYRGIQTDPEGVYKTLQEIPKTKDAYLLLRSLDPNTLTLSQRCARLIFLMKACFNGVYRTNQQGQFNVPMGDKIYALPTLQELRDAQEHLRGTTLKNEDYSATCMYGRAGDLVYLDPPYKQLGRYRGEYGFGSKFCENRFEELVSLVHRLDDSGVNVMLSHSFDPMLIDLLPSWQVHQIQIHRSIAGALESRGAVAEIVMTNYKS